MLKDRAIWKQYSPGPIQQIGSNWGHENLYIKRLDLIQSWADGNKYYKLKYPLTFAFEHNVKTIVSKGGMFSNHLYSLANACAEFEIDLISVVRSYVEDNDNPSLRELRRLSKEILFLKPHDYDHFDEAAARLNYPNAMFIDEGGKSIEAIRTMKELMDECLSLHPTHIIVSGGSMTTACGLIASAPADMTIIIVPAWKGCSTQYIEDMLSEFQIAALCNWEIWPEAHFGGFAKYDHTLIDFMSSFTLETGIPLDPVYTGKMMFAIKEKIKSGYFSEEDTILAIHSGGLQGIHGFAYRFPEDWGDYAKLVFENNE